jgi:hypothetical protein
MKLFKNDPTLVFLNIFLKPTISGRRIAKKNCKIFIERNKYFHYYDFYTLAVQLGNTFVLHNQQFKIIFF